MKIVRRFFDTFVMPIVDLRTLGWAFIIMCALYLLDPEGLSVMRVVLYTILFWILSLSIRKAIMPYRRDDENGRRVRMKLSHLMRLAAEGNVAAAIVCVGILSMQAIVALSFIIWLR